MSNVERLRGCVTASRGIDCRDPDLLLSSAAEIERLTAENERLLTVIEQQKHMLGVLANGAANMVGQNMPNPDVLHQQSTQHQEEK